MENRHVNQHDTRTGKQMNPSILHPPKITDYATERSTISSVVQKHVKATRMKGEGSGHEEETYKEEYEEVSSVAKEKEEEWWSDYDEWSDIDRRACRPTKSKKKKCPAH